MAFSPESQCAGKRRYLTKRVAKMVARRTAANFGGAPLETYLCVYCDSYHNGHARVPARV